MISIPDAICSSWLISYSILGVLILIVAKLLWSSFFKNEKSNTRFRIVTLLVFPVLVILFIYLAGSVFGWGYVNSFKSNIHSDKWTCFAAEGTYGMHVKGGGRTVSNRLYVLDPLTGKRIHKTVIGDFSKFLSLKGDTLLYQSGRGEYVLYDVSRNLSLANLNPETLPVQVKELSAGLESCEYDKDTRLLKAGAKNGQTYFIDPFTLKIQQSPVPVVLTRNADVEAQRIRLDSLHILCLKSKNNDDKLFQLCDKGGKLIGGDTTFLYAQFLGRSSKQKCFLVLSFETTDKSSFVITCFSYDCKPLWKIKQPDLGATDLFTQANSAASHDYGASLDFPYIQNESFLFTVHGFVCAADLHSGKLNWKTRL
ncbi:MAG TPA: hypothetical protein VNZ86_02435 [Bacteroidia bacterium]|jgi:hypothetical protein|nr:hypothetical protein [Bacteroidia bacterium]